MLVVSPMRLILSFELSEGTRDVGRDQHLIGADGDSGILFPGRLRVRWRSLWGSVAVILM